MDYVGAFRRVEEGENPKFTAFVAACVRSYPGFNRGHLPMPS